MESSKWANRQQRWGNGQQQGETMDSNSGGAMDSSKVRQEGEQTSCMLRCRLRSSSEAGEGGLRGGERGGLGRRAGLGGPLGGLGFLGAGPPPLSAPEDFLCKSSAAVTT